MRYGLKVFLSAILALCIWVGVLFGCVEGFALQRSFFESQDARLGIHERMHVSEDDYTKAMGNVLSYIKGERDSISTNITYNDKARDMFNEKEAEHMVDVKDLYLNFRFVAIVCVVFAVLLLLILILDAPREFIAVFSVGYLRMSIIFMICLGALGIYAAIDFTSFWNAFHGVFFSNDLWLLNPATDFMIRMLPEAVFQALVTRILLVFVGVFMIIGLGCFIYLLRRKKASLVLYS
ncbi:hypothetical protein A4S06_05520 [Erysipelotrichaceae bacterium MTC7]|nr:hypothetical protein A4S06_05520 [Erysipelotrichaceae bacterium MTC7]